MQDNASTIQVLDTTRQTEKYSNAWLDCKNELNAFIAAKHQMVSVSWSVSDSKNSS